MQDKRTGWGRAQAILLAGLTTVALATGVAGMRTLFGAGPGPLLRPAHAEAPRSPSTQASKLPGTQAFAEVEGVRLHLLAARPVGVMYHEASKDDALAMTPLGRCVRNANRFKFVRPAPTAGPRYTIMSSRGRPHPSTSAVDMAMPAGALALAPATGIVAYVKPYRLYGRYLDYRVSIVPLGRPDLRVILLHVVRPRVHRGSVLVAGATPIGRPRVFPFSSQVNDYLGPNVPHIHIEVKRVGAAGLATSS